MQGLKRYLVALLFIRKRIYLTSAQTHYSERDRGELAFKLLYERYSGYR